MHVGQTDGGLHNDQTDNDLHNICFAKYFDIELYMGIFEIKAKIEMIQYHI